MIEAELKEGNTSILSSDGDDDEKTRLEKYKEILKRVLTYGWNKFTREEKRKTRIIFDYYGFEFGDIDKEKQEDISREFISVNIHEDCRKYKIAGDNYFLILVILFQRIVKIIVKVLVRVLFTHLSKILTSEMTYI